MKLAAKYNRVTLIASIIVFLFTGVIYYSVIHYILTGQLDKDLAIEEDEIAAYVKTYGKLPLAGSFKEQKVSYHLIDPNHDFERRYFYNDYFNESEQRIEPGRSLIRTIEVKGKLYSVTVTKSRLEAEDLVRIIFLITLSVTILLLITLLLINRFILNNIWRPFYGILLQMKAFNLADKNDIRIEPTKIDEFAELNAAVATMSLRVKQDYRELKSFTDNASHEMMTPLAVINSKLDTLIQTETFSDSQGELIEDIYVAVGKLSRLNQSLLMLAKIENNLIGDQETINLDELISQKTRQFQELLQSQNLNLKTELATRKIDMNKHLADMLINNLLSNAIRHNYKGGEIFIQLNDSQLTISNTGLAAALVVNKVFERFYKNAASEGMGLGLAISNQICNLYRFKLNYTYQDTRHTFKVSF
ncbi:two-component sensor histidine kinase [Pedobacter ginsengisoli]|uniref:histidine kinase n=1 Tax=Pedobacter ginsengisoli TaxID=363852 RepID=A0A2D1U684_9SPHI|nr:HAMP domain-containing sensor histidine kinase [Pedobacter ginsengisoli]ATP57120.1 two-component sensor histidine kinase [Pedobacter ginsengisoli]